MKYGSHNDRSKWVRTLVANRIAPFTTVFPETYTKVHLDWNDALYGVDSNIDCVPHLAQWGVDKVEHHKVVRNWVVKKALVAYLVNMNDDELAMVDPLLSYIESFGQVFRVQCFDSSVELCVLLNGVQRTLLINVMNMMEYLGKNNDLQDYVARDSLN